MTPDIVMVVGDERNAEANWQRLFGRAASARRISGAKSIRAAFLEAAKVAKTPHFFLVDGDNWLAEDFKFQFDFVPESDEIFVWRALNPVNGLIYPHGGIKLLPTEKILNTSLDDRIDVFSALAKCTYQVEVVASEHRFNSSPLESWRTAFRECAKLASRSIPGFPEELTAHYIDVWCNKGAESAFGSWCMSGARDGRSFGEAYANQPDEMRKVNDYPWLRRVFDQRYGHRI